MMDPSKEHSFEDQWKKAFDEASVTPPASAWEAIEARLDRDEDNKVVPLWWRSPKLWYAAASIAALLLVGGVWLKMSANEQTGKSEIAQKAGKSVPENNGTEALKNSGNTDTHEKTNQETENTVASIGPENDAAGKITGRNLSGKNGAKKICTGKIDLRKEIGKCCTTRSGGSGPGKCNRRCSIAANQSSQTAGLGSNKAQQIVNERNTAIAMEAGVEKPVDISIVSPELLTAIGTNGLDVFVQKRYIFYKPQEEAVVEEKKKHKEYWAGVGLMPASFNPDVILKTSPSSYSSSFTSQSISKQKAVIGKSEAGASYSVQTQGGLRISKHWSVETGLSYLQGNSRYEGGGYLLDAATNGASNVLENTLADVSYGNKNGMQTPNYPAVSNNLNNNNIYIDVNKQVANNFQFLQVPVQAGFTLNPDGKLSYSVLGGMMANFFLNNELESANGELIKTTPSDDVYKTTNWAATTGLRFNYRLSSRWRASLTGSYQKALSSGFKSNQNVESHPYLYGVSWGMRYSF